MSLIKALYFSGEGYFCRFNDNNNDTKKRVTPPPQKSFLVFVEGDVLGILICFASKPTCIIIGAFIDSRKFRE